MRLIDIEPLQKERWHLHRYVAGVYAARVEEMELEEVPTVDAAPVVHGRWEKTNNPRYSPFDGSPEHLSICTNCAYTIEQYDFLYCPNCGTKMDMEGR